MGQLHFPSQLKLWFWLVSLFRLRETRTCILFTGHYIMISLFASFWAINRPVLVSINNSTKQTGSQWSSELNQLTLQVLDRWPCRCACEPSSLPSDTAQSSKVSSCIACTENFLWRQQLIREKRLLTAPNLKAEQRWQEQTQNNWCLIYFTSLRF